MIGRGRPLRFLMVVIGTWTGARVALLWEPGAVPPLPRVPSPLRIVPAAAAAPRAPVVSVAKTKQARTADSPRPTRAVAGRTASPAEEPTPGAVVASAGEQVAAAAAPVIALATPTRYDAVAPIVADLPAAPRRWSGSAWAILREGGGPAGLATPQLGGSQAGARLAYRLDEAGRVAIVARAASPLRMRQREAAIGVEWRPSAAPLRLVVEQRIAIAGTRGGTALGALGGVSEVALPADFRLDGYAQGGVIARRGGGEGYVDASARVARPVAHAGAARIELGVGAWGAAQRGAARLDVGPAAAAVVAVGTRALRVAVEWRARVAGDARPGSGAALSLGSDF